MIILLLRVLPLALALVDIFTSDWFNALCHWLPNPF